MLFLHASTANEIDAAFERVAELRAGGLVVSADPFFTARKDQIVALEARHEIPAIHIWREFVMARRADQLRSRTRRRLSPSWCLHRQDPQRRQTRRSAGPEVVKLELVINLNTAKALGLTIPPPILARADEIIE